MDKDFNSLEIYRKAEDLVIDIYKITSKFPKEEIYGIISQLRRAMVSVAINIAEAYGRFHFKDRSSFLYNSRGSLLEVKSLLQISLKLGFLDSKKAKLLDERIEKLAVKINNFINYLRKQ